MAITFGVPLPADVTFQISTRAVQIARELAPKETGAGASALTPNSSEGVIGIGVGGADYMLYQERGFEPYVMEALSGLTIPIRTPGGGIVFRRVKPGSPGTPKIVSRDERGVLTASKLQWVHPGLTGQHFIQQGLQQALQEWMDTVGGKALVTSLKGTEYRKLIDVLETGI